ncbi:DNA/RNA non-specific endonuclease [Pistricoccus aurantiacus]|uniref:DNA/RNA non-specific endonuclease n=1 Tax=Pistricoccus aurantiacus TaxID=1883414 RepID=A0A5B8SSS5_9GAMM|nr:DNA/RNA non-specific endonuclease [Pistricoccus aurantiacus]QEA39057.1 DNA/RNA non-specific endonuclease [Pistricoccus aurantiacus]
MKQVSRLWRRGLRRVGVVLVFTLVSGGLWYSQEIEYRERLSWMGVPTWESFTLTSAHRILRNDGFVLGWSDIRGSALWVSYRLHAVKDVHIDSRPNFREDWRTLWPIDAQSYANSGFDRGHLAPNYAIAAVHGSDAQRQTFLMSNITPQRPELNRRLWQRLEEVIMDRFAPRFGNLQVITGPIFPRDFLGNVFQRVGFVEIPEAFYKIVLVPGDSPRVLAFIMPQEVKGNEPLDRFLVSVDEVELRTGLDFFPALSEAEALALESSIRRDGWGLAEVARLPGRFE